MGRWGHENDIGNSRPHFPPRQSEGRRTENSASPVCQRGGGRETGRKIFSREKGKDEVGWRSKAPAQRDDSNQQIDRAGVRENRAGRMGLILDTNALSAIAEGE